MSRYLTFDCYDTLVQYSAGKRAAIAGGDAAYGPDDELPDLNGLLALLG